MTHPPVSRIPAVNVASVPQRSPLRYPGGKTWLIPHIREWLADGCDLLIEPFGGGGIVSLTAVMENLADRAILVEMDRDVAAFWHSALRHGNELAERVLALEMTTESVRSVESTPPSDVLDHAFRTLVLNRTRRGGILAPGASLTKNGENGNGVGSRWYPDTLTRRLKAISAYRDRIAFYEGDGVAFLESMANATEGCWFIDPPYTASGGKRAGSRLYACSDVPHGRIFEALAESTADFLMTYDCSEEIQALAAKHRFSVATVEMKNGHHARIPEMIITRRNLFT